MLDGEPIGNGPNVAPVEAFPPMTEFSSSPERLVSDGGEKVAQPRQVPLSGEADSESFHVIECEVSLAWADDPSEFWVPQAGLSRSGVEVLFG